MKTPFKKETPIAYRGDTYIEDCEKAAKSGPAWVRIFVLFAIAASLADLYFIDDLVAKVLNASTSSPLVILVATVLAFGLFFSARALGNSWRRYRAFGEDGDKAVIVMAITGLVLIFVGVTVFRYFAEAADAANQAMVAASAASQSSLSGGGSTVVTADPIAATALLTVSMLISAITSFINAFFSRDAVQERIHEKAKGSFASDKETYTSVWNETYLDPAEEEKLETKEREYDRKLKTAKSEVLKLCTRLSAVVDPADAVEVMKVAKWAMSWAPKQADTTKEVVENEAA